MWEVSTTELRHYILQDGRMLKTSYWWENRHKNELSLSTFHRHQMRAARIVNPTAKLTTTMKIFTIAEGFWVKTASTNTWKKCNIHL